MTFGFGDCEIDLEGRELQRAKLAVNVGSYSQAER
jgi:hypothetical protein